MDSYSNSGEKTSLLAGRCVMVIDDEALVRNATKSMLEFRKASVLLAESGAHALEVLKTTPIAPDLILLDLTMPGMSGAETLAEIRKHDSGIPVIISSGHPVDINDFDAETAPDGVLVKPYAMATFLEIIEKAIEA